MAGYTKLFSAILTSSVWEQDLSTRIVWITMLAMCDRYGVVEATSGGIAHMARVPKKDADRALQVFLSPDDESRSKEWEGRRIEEIDGGFRILNYVKYREKQRSDERTDYFREKKREQRGRVQDVHMSTNVHQCQPIADADASPEAKDKDMSNSVRRPSSPSLKKPSKEDPDFEAFWGVWLKKVAKGSARKAWASAKKGGKLPPVEVLIAKVGVLQATEDWSKDGRKFQPHAATWLNREGWEDEVPLFTPPTPDDDPELEADENADRMDRFAARNPHLVQAGYDHLKELGGKP